MAAAPPPSQSCESQAHMYKEHFSSKTLPPPPPLLPSPASPTSPASPHLPPLPPLPPPPLPDSSLVRKDSRSGVAANCTWGLTASDLGMQPCSFKPLHECWNRHATNTSEVREACLRWSLRSLDPKPHVSTTCYDLFMCFAPRQPRLARDNIYDYVLATWDVDLPGGVNNPRKAIKDNFDIGSLRKLTMS